MSSDPALLLSHLLTLPTRLSTYLLSLLQTTSTHLTTTLSSLTLEKWIRIVAIAGAYILLRPYLLRLVAKIQGRQLRGMENAADTPQDPAGGGGVGGGGTGAGAGAGAGAAGGRRLADGTVVQSIDPRTGEVRKSKVVLPEDSSGDEEEDAEGEGGQATGMQWGKRARRRQKVMVRRLMEAEEKRRREEEEVDSDKEIEDLLVG